MNDRHRKKTKAISAAGVFVSPALTPQSRRYFALVRKFPLRVIKSESQYDDAIRVIQGLAIRSEDELIAGEADYLEALVNLIESYEKEHHSMGPDGLALHRRLKWLMEESGLSQEKLAKLLAISQPLVTLILQGKRELTVSHIRKLSEHFHVSPRYFIKSK